MVCSTALDFSSFGTIPLLLIRSGVRRQSSGLILRSGVARRFQGIRHLSGNDHFAVTAVELEDKALSVVKNIERGGGRYLFASLLFRA